MNWGIRPHWIDDPNDWSHPITARAETVAEKPSFRGAFEERRCLVLADGFYEWKGSRGAKTPYRIERGDDEAFAFAGLWETWSSNGDELETVTIITTESNDLMESIHDRMPVILDESDERRWPLIVSFETETWSVWVRSPCMVGRSVSITPEYPWPTHISLESGTTGMNDCSFRCAGRIHYLSYAVPC